jgi:hypothetical protein
MIEPRIYRAAFLPALLAVVLAMFSLESRPRPLPQTLAADVVFEGAQAAATTRAVIATGRDRRAGTRGDRAAGRLVEQRLRTRGFAVEVDRFEHEGEQLLNVLGRRAGQTRRQLVVVAARDATGVPDAAGSAADTAALLEIARVFAGRPSEKTLVLASVDGSALGEVGTLRLADQLGDPGLVDGVVVLSDLGSGSGRPIVGTWSNDPSSAGIGLQRTVSESLRQEFGAVAPRPGAAGQVARLAFPLGVGGQGPLLAAGFDAVRITGDSELTGGEADEKLDEDRLEALGRAGLRSIAALDRGARPDHGPPTYVSVVSQVMPGWVLSLLALALILPALVASIDAFARARRRREPVYAWLLWVAAAVGPFAIGLALTYVLALTGALPDPPAPVAPERFPLGGARAAALGLVVVSVGLAWLGLRALVRRARPGVADTTAPGAGVALSLVLSLAALAAWALNPYAALMLAPALHLWLLTALVELPVARRWRVALVLVGLIPPGLVALYDLIALSVGPLGGAWYLLLLVAGGHVGPAYALLGCVLAGVLGSVLSIALSIRPPGPAAAASGERSVRGPATYAGPGSLGGTPSGLPRR